VYVSNVLHSIGVMRGRKVEVVVNGITYNSTKDQPLYDKVAEAEAGGDLGMSLDEAAGQE